MLEAEQLDLLQGTRTVVRQPSPGPAAGGGPSPSLKERTLEFQRRTVEEALERSGGNWAAAARELGMHRSNLHHLGRRLGLKE